MCGIIGIASYSPVNQSLFDGLTVLQHRGQDAAGMMTYDGNQLYLRKEKGLVRDVFRTRHMKKLPGNFGIGHVRYPTAGGDNSAEAQPFYVNSPFGIALSHNGNLTNANTLQETLYRTDRRHINTRSDSEVLLNVLAHELGQNNELQLSPQKIFEAVSSVHKRVRGAYSAVALIAGHGLLAFRDPKGIRPLVFGHRDTSQGRETMVASESVAIDTLGFKPTRDIHPGEAIFVDLQGNVHHQLCAPPSHYSPCLFEYVYFARPDSIIDGISVYNARLRMGEALANKVLKTWPDHDIDVIIPIPDTSRTVALQMAYTLGIKYREGLVKNRYIARTFIMPGQAIREKSVRQKLNAISLEFKNRNVLLVDDSIVRGTTSEQIIQMSRDAGAKKVYFASASPPVRYPNVYGIDMPTRQELIAHNRNEMEIATTIGADRLIYQDLEDLEQAVLSPHGNHLSNLDNSCFSGHYITGDIDDDYLDRLEKTRNDTTRQSDSDLTDLNKT